MNDSVAFNTFTMLYKYHLYLVSEYFHYFKIQLHPLRSTLPWLLEPDFNLDLSDAVLHCALPIPINT